MKNSPVIYINGRFLTQELTGVQRYATEIVKAVDAHLATLSAQDRPVCKLVAPKGANADVLSLKFIKFETGGLGHGHVWEQVSLPFITADGPLLNLGNSAPAFHRRTLTVIHDAIVYRMPERFSRAYRTVHQNLGRWLARNSKIATVSLFSQTELSEVLGIPRDEIVVAPNGADHIGRVTPDPAVLTRLRVQPGQYFLFVGSPAPHKNLATALQAFALASPNESKFVVVGAAKAKVFGEGLAEVPENVIVAGRLTDEEIAALYKGAAAFVFPSLYEGFGIPPLEAMVHGCPVLASDIPSCREVCGNAAIFFDPSDASSLAHLISRVADKEIDQARLVQAGYARIGAFSWSKSAKTLLSHLF